MANLLIFGASRGLGAALSAGVPAPGDTAWLVSRSRPDPDRRDGVNRRWIEADLASDDASRRIAHALADQPLDVAIYNAGLWERQGFTPDYDFEQVEAVETQRIIAVNLTSAITCIRCVLPNLRRSARGRIILIGSTSGLDNNSSVEVAYAASKFGLRGAGQALRENLRKDRIAVTCINPGDMAAEIPYERGPDEVVAAFDGSRIPVHDIVAIVRCVIGLSGATCVKEIDVPAMTDAGV